MQEEGFPKQEAIPLQLHFPKVNVEENPLTVRTDWPLACLSWIILEAS